jgi:hypothetical protein
MGQVDPGSAGLVAVAFHAGIEMIVVGAAVFLAIALLAYRAKFSRDQRLRRGASSGYHQRDLARYTPSGMGQPEDEAVDPRARPLAPTFVAPLPTRRRGGKEDRRRVATSPSMASLGRTHAQPATAYGGVDPATSLPRAFDAEEAQRLRPQTPIPSAFIPASMSRKPEVEPMYVPALDEDPDLIPPPDGALPLLVQPPPSPGRDARPKAG